MALSASALGSLIDANLSTEGAIGANKTIFSNKVAAGIVMSIVGKAFATVDAGVVPGSGTGLGVGIVGLSSSNMKSLALAAMSSTGVNAPKLMQAIMTATVTHLGTATLTSSHAPVFSGTGTIVVGSIPVVISEMKGNIKSQLQASGAIGDNLDNLCLAIATGIVTDILSTGTGTVVISGSPSGTPSGGAGAGTGIVS